ncbi:DUF3137 domain-containing protein [Blastomonas fulva]|uniref:DUF3137 domain-containing protein n=1 Tax=Blastomonas fulva TaxID=1550728 RepID=UPI003D2B3264
MITVPDVDTLMAGDLGTWLAGQDQARKDAKSQAAKWWIAGAVIGLPFLLGLTIEGFLGQVFALVGMGIMAICAGKGAMIRQAVVTSLKTQMNTTLARTLGISYSAAASFGEEFELASRFDLLPSYTRKTCQDLWQGDLGGTRFNLYEATLIERRGSGKNARDVTVFSGVILKMHFARDFHGVTLIERQRMRLALFGDSQTKDGIRLERVKMVDPRFEKAFDVYGSDAVEARYLVHPAYCERLIALEDKFEGKKLKALFHKGDVIVTMESDDLFESGSLDPRRDRELLARTIEQFRAMADMITSLNERPRG